LGSLRRSPGPSGFGFNGIYEEGKIMDMRGGDRRGNERGKGKERGIPPPF